MTLFLNPQHLAVAMRTVLVDIGPLAHLSGNGALTGLAMKDEKSLISYEKGIVIENDQIVKIANSNELLEEYGQPNTELSNLSENIITNDRIVSLNGRSVIPGLVDAHSHIIWSGDRSREVRWKLNGKSYSEIASMGGGIVSTCLLYTSPSPRD